MRWIITKVFWIETYYHDQNMLPEVSDIWTRMLKNLKAP